ncbi:serine/threonine protein kinase [Agromyces sp. ISL-38]|uniref:serine/threonine-protein kinase n=1 Tax=Agromyces sp. ISL-38 TaxID=2819107 RepID=UPI001BE92399|nr:serine/threonine-protein kinase [Agromyces sp. ISL-38]MBT2497511.1 serine/threonine protein kinase [Agromyces sp. ISL-38]MBT2517390.1 serine/threonine protein kinase [Streptomyces sp. ISL-90]
MTTSSDHVVGDSFVGAVLGARYRLDARIGRGGMATVYRAEDLTLGRPVAVKVFAEAAEGIDDAERRRSETALLASLRHRALVTLYDASRDPASGREFLVMELVDGRDLREALKHGPLGPADAAGLLADVAEALHVIHERGIVHRDVKPANVLLEPAHLPSRTWNAKLADFGIARLIDDARLTRAGLLVGTPGYLSPEQVSGAAPSPAADIYSLGLLVLEARTGVAAFPGPAVEAASARLVRDPEIPESLGADWVSLLRSMTAREPGDRPSALDVAIAATALDTSRASVSNVTAPTIAFADVAAAQTQPAEAAAAASGASDASSGSETAATQVLPSPSRSFFDAPAGTESAESTRRAARAASEQRSRRWVRPTIAISLLVAIGAVVAVLLFSSLTAQQAATTPEPLPAVPGELGVHLEELDEAVTGG